MGKKKKKKNTVMIHNTRNELAITMQGTRGTIALMAGYPVRQIISETQEWTEAVDQNTTRAVYTLPHSRINNNKNILNTLFWFLSLI